MSEETIIVNGHRIAWKNMTDEKVDALVNNAKELVKTYTQQEKVMNEMVKTVRVQKVNAQDELEGWIKLRNLWRIRKIQMEAVKAELIPPEGEKDVPVDTDQNTD